MDLSLISALDGGERGGCLQLTKVDAYNPQTREYEPLANQGDISKYFGFEDGNTLQTLLCFYS
jgi:hypothetical protein